MKKPKEKIEYNKLCLGCVNNCKQFSWCKVIRCRLYRRKEK